MRLFALVVAFIGMLSAEPLMTVYKTPTCGCCGKWVEHMRNAGFEVKVNDVQSTAPYRKQYGVPDKLLSCHTAVAGGYAVEGHVPASDVQRLLKTRPKVVGIAVPGMPIGSPGMEQGPSRQAYSVVSFDKTGKVTEFQKYEAKP